MKTFTCVIFMSVLFCIFVSQQINAQTSVVTQHNNLSRTGWNNTETVLNSANVKKGLFGKLYSRPVDDQLYAQLLVLKNVSIPGKGNKNIVIAATVNNSVYAYDADLAGVTAPYWQVSLTPAGLRAIRNTDMTGACGGNYKDFSGNIGIVSTPVIDSLTNTLYVVARSVGTSGTGFVQYLHALDITTGNERANSPKLITAQIAANGYGSVGGILSLDPQRENQRCGLLLLNGIIYLSYASHCDWGPYHGWILGYDKTSLLQTTVYCSTPDGYGGGIWMSGGAPAADNIGNIYVAIGNGTAGFNGNMSDTRDRSESAVKLLPSGNGFITGSFFTPNNYTTLENGDLDVGPTEVMLVPNTNQLLTGCKDGKIFLMNRDSMGGYHVAADSIVQTIDLGTNAHLRSTFAYYKGSQKEYIYSWSENSLLKAFPYNRTLNLLNVGNVIHSAVQGPVGNSGAFLSVSSNGSVDSTAVLWTSFAATGDANASVRPGILYAFDANDVTKELWNSVQDTLSSPVNYAKFNCPTIANGKVYLPTFSNQFVVYGLTGGSADTCNSPDIAFKKPAVASSIKNSTNNAPAAFDGDVTTGWASVAQVDPQYIYVDLGTRYDLCSVVLRWEAALGKNFTIDVSDNASSWTTLATKTNNASFTNNISLKGSGRYVRMYGTANATDSGYSLYSFEVYGNPSAGDCPIPTGLSTSDIFENTATVHWQPNSATNFNLQYKAVASVNWTTVVADTNVIVLPNLVCGTDYLCRVQSVCSATDKSAYSSLFSFSQMSCGSNCNPLPTRWSTLDIGNTALPGSACFTPDTFALKGSGDDIGNNADAFQFAFKTLSGDGEFTARVLSMDQSNSLNKCGIMIRESLSAGSKNAFIGLTSGNGATFQYRAATDGNSSTTNSGTGVAPPYWVKLTKSGSVFEASISADGNVWSPLGSPVDVGFGNGVPVYAGLGLTSHNNAVLSTAKVDNYAMTNGVLPVSLLSFNASLNLAHKVELEWKTTLEMNSSYFVIERSTSNNQFEALDTVKASLNGPFVATYHDVDNFPVNGINYYRLKMVDIDGRFTYSALVAVRVNNSKAPSVYPNPAKTFINITQGTDPVKYITIYDIAGRKLIRLSNISAGNITQVSIADLMKGTYVVEITTSNSIYTDKLLIR